MIHLPPPLHQIVDAAKIAGKVVVGAIKEFVEFIIHTVNKI